MQGAGAESASPLPRHSTSGPASARGNYSFFHRFGRATVLIAPPNLVAIVENAGCGSRCS